jgi:predicted Zn-dependent protease
MENGSNKKVYLGQKFLVDPERHELSIKHKLESAISSIDKYQDRILLDDITISYKVKKCKRDIQDSTNNHITKEELMSYLWVTVKAKGREKSYFTIDAYCNQPCGLDILENLDDLIDQAVNKIIKKIEAKPPPKNITNVLMKGSVASIFIHEIIGHLLEGDIVKNSIFKDKYKQKVAPSFLTIKDVPYIENGFGNCIYDDEGVEGKDVTLIKNGIIYGIMTDRQTAAKLRLHGFDIELTGNGRASTSVPEPMPRMRNTVMEHGSKNEEELIKALNSGIYLTSASGGDVDALTGDFVLYIDEAYWVEDGQIKHPVDITEIKGNVMSTLKSIVDIGSESTVETFSGPCVKRANLFFTQYLPVSCKAPSILFFDWDK